MSWIEIIDDTTWDGELGDLKGRVGDPRFGRVDHIMSIHSLNPRSMAAHDAVYRSAMRGTATLRKADRELIAFVVSQINECHY